MRHFYVLFVVLILLLATTLTGCNPISSTGSGATEMNTAETTAEEATAEPAEEAAAVATEEPAEESADEEATSDEESGEDAAAEEAAEPMFMDFDPANFTDSTNIDNEWSPLQPGMQWVYEGESLDGEELVPHRIEFTVTDLTKEIDGVRVVVAWVVDTINEEEIVESELSFYAQDDDGTVWYFGEYPEEYEGGEFVAAPTWIAGLEEAKPGVKMVKEPTVGMPVYYQGWGPAVEWSDFSIVSHMEDEVCIPVDCYTDVLVVDESSLGEVGAFQQKLYAKGVGNIKVEWTGEDATQETLELVELNQLDADSLAEVHAAAMEQEARAYANSPEVYGQTNPLE
ncbi:MAG: hypothetical protein R3C14_13350 [Caldilineaceae bacterium]